MHGADKLGYYKILGVDVRASWLDIKSAYRQKVQELHPDKNLDKDTTAEFQYLQEAYEVLSNEKSRQQYDANSSIPANDIINQKKPSKPLQPIVCSVCNLITAQPRYKIFYSVYGYIFDATKVPRQGIFCSNCETKEAVKASIITMVCGWWSLPGAIWSVQSLIQNLTGGSFESQNAHLQGYQALYFAENMKFPLARATAIEAIKLAEIILESKGVTTKENTHNYSELDKLKELKSTLNKLIDAFPKDIRKIELIKTNQLFNKRFSFQSILLLTFISVILFGYKIISDDLDKREQFRIEQERQEAENLKRFELPLPASGLYRLNLQINLRPDNHPPFVITNKPNESILLKIVRISDNIEIMSIFVRAGETIETAVPVGAYKVKIATGQKWYGEKMYFGPKTSYAIFDSVFEFHKSGTQLIGKSITLTQIKNGNLSKKSLGSNDF